MPLSRHRLERGRWSGAGWPLRLARPVCPAAGRGRAGSPAGWRGAGGGAWPGLFYVSLTGRRGDAAALPKPCSKRFGKCAASSFHGFEPGPPCFLGEGEEEGGERTRHPQSAGRLRPPPPAGPISAPAPHHARYLPRPPWELGMNPPHRRMAKANGGRADLNLAAEAGSWTEAGLVGPSGEQKHGPPRSEVSQNFRSVTRARSPGPRGLGPPPPPWPLRPHRVAQMGMGEFLLRPH